ncbi:MAG TPA: hypothetical protein PK364_14825, partial [Synergistaceae bacterium]|nr:hypothetical protein [Synergistaceae bacterium]
YLFVTRFPSGAGGIISPIYNPVNPSSSFFLRFFYLPFESFPLFHALCRKSFPESHYDKPFPSLSIRIFFSDFSRGLRKVFLLKA